MATGRNIKLTKQIGEYLVACELSRRGFLTTIFSGNKTKFDIAAANESGITKLIEVKTINGESWQFSIDKFVNVKMEGNKQIVGNKTNQPIKDSICVLVNLGKKYGEDNFYILKWCNLQDILIQHHKKYLEKHNGERPRAKESMHCSLLINEIEKYKDKWEIINS